MLLYVGGMEEKIDIQTLHEMLNSMGFDSFQGDKLGNDLFINDPERAERIYEAAKDGADGSTHAERLEDIRAYLELLDLPDAIRQNIEEEIDKAEAYLEKTAQLHYQVG